MSLLSTIGGFVNKTISKIYGQEVKVGAIIVPAGQPLPPILPTVTLTPAKVYEYGKGKAMDWKPYLIVGAVVVGVILLTRKR